MMRAVLVFISTTLLFSCTDEEASRRALEGAGYREIQFEGYSTVKCGQGDHSCTVFTAIGPTGREVHGAVGCGMGCGKGCTIRTD
jgi:hypothetical protein